MFHELVHSTGRMTRLNRSGIAIHTPFGSKVYSKVELVAEIGASFLCGVTGIMNEIRDS
ncbi:zincin-like metallopeptidase domain-containing protein [Candidatus Latescibacterota bacterium]